MKERYKYYQFQTASDGTKVTHYELSVLQVDGIHVFEKNTNRGDAGDFFNTDDEITPVSSNVHSESYYFWKGNNATPVDSGIHVTDIAENSDGSITATFFYNANSSQK